MTIIDNLGFVGNQNAKSLMEMNKNYVIDLNQRLAKRYAKKK